MLDKNKTKSFFERSIKHFIYQSKPQIKKLEQTQSHNFIFVELSCQDTFLRGNKYSGARCNK